MLKFEANLKLKTFRNGLNHDMITNRRIGMVGSMESMWEGGVGGTTKLQDMLIIYKSEMTFEN